MLWHNAWIRTLQYWNLKIKALDKMFSTFLRPIVKKWGTAQVKYQFKYSNITINVRSQSMFMFSNDCPGKEHLREA